MERIRKLNEQLEIRNELLKKTFGRYMSDEIVAEILDTPDGLEMGGQKKKLTLMMSDLRGFTQMCETMQPAALLKMETIRQETPDAEWIIEYIRREQEGEGLRQDIEELLGKRG